MQQLELLPRCSDLRTESYGTFDDVDVQHEETWVVKPTSARLSRSCLARKSLYQAVVMLIVALGMFTYHSMTYIT